MGGNSPVIIDISLPLGNALPVWPGSSGVTLETIHSMEKGSSSNISRLSCEVHSGTHVDAPSHFIPTGNTISQIPLDVFIGDAVVVDLPTSSHITESDLERLRIPADTERLLLRTRNSAFWHETGNVFQQNYIALTAGAAEWVVNRKIRLIGIDYLSVQPYEDSTQKTHLTLLSSDVVILEGLNLSRVKPGKYELICLPLSLENAEGSPVRAVLRRKSEVKGEYEN